MDAFIHYPCPKIEAAAYVMYQDSSDNYWLGTWGVGLWQFSQIRKGKSVISNIR